MSSSSKLFLMWSKIACNVVVSLMGISTSYLIFEFARDLREQRYIQRENMEIERYYRRVRTKQKDTNY